MQIVRISELDKKRVKIILEDRTYFPLYKAEQRRYDLAEGEESLREVKDAIWEDKERGVALLAEDGNSFRRSEQKFLLSGHGKEPCIYWSGWIEQRLN